MTAPLPTPAEVEGMRERHVRYVDTDGNEWCGAPVSCGDWPCDAARLVALVDLRDKVAAVNRTFTAGVERDRDEARARLAAVLAECDRLDEDPGEVGPYTLVADRIRRVATREAS